MTVTPDPTAFALREEVPSLEEIMAQAPLLWTSAASPITSASATTGALLVAPFPLRILSLHVTMYAKVPASATDNWTLTLRKSATGPAAAVDIVARTLTDGLGNRVTTGFEAAPWNENNRNLAAGDVAWLACAATGSPAPLVGGLATLRYART